MSDLVRNPEAWISHNEAHMSPVVRKLLFCMNAKTKTQISFAVTAKLISAFVFTTYIVQSLYFLYTKFHTYSPLVWLYSPVYVESGRKPRRAVFSQGGSYNVVPGSKIRSLISTSQYYIKHYDIFIDLPREETCIQHTL